MNINELSQKLDKITDDFASQIKAEYPENSQVPAKEQDIGILAHEVHDTLRDFKEAIIEYLKQA
jgi:hypothetical protein